MSKGGGAGPYDPNKGHLNASNLGRLLNSPVAEAERFTRPMDIGPIRNVYVPQLGLCHSGVRVKLEDKSQWLVHKGPNYGGRGGNTVVVDARHMSSNWTSDSKPVDVKGSKTVSNFVKAGGTHYDIGPVNNCHGAARRMVP